MKCINPECQWESTDDLIRMWCPFCASQLKEEDDLI